MKKNKVILFFLIFLSGEISWTTTSVFFPKVLKLQGKAWLVTAQGKKNILHLNEELKGSAILESEANSEVQIQLDRDRFIYLIGSTQIRIPAIAWESGQAPIIELSKGSLRWKTKSEHASYIVLIKSDLLDLIAPIGDFVFSYDPEKVWTEVRCYQGKMEFLPMNGDKSIIIDTGQKGYFQGIREQGEIIYDVLLEGKKIPRGELKGPVSMDKIEAALYSDATEKRNAAEKLKKIELEKKRIAILRKDQICQNPFAKFKECAWICEDKATNSRECDPQSESSHCARYRCDANGRWSEKYILPLSQTGICKKDPVVGQCDY